MKSLFFFFIGALTAVLLIPELIGWLNRLFPSDCAEEDVPTIDPDLATMYADVSDGNPAARDGVERHMPLYGENDMSGYE